MAMGGACVGGVWVSSRVCVCARRECWRRWQLKQECMLCRGCGVCARWKGCGHSEQSSTNFRFPRSVWVMGGGGCHPFRLQPPRATGCAPICVAHTRTRLSSGGHVWWLRHWDVNGVYTARVPWWGGGAVAHGGRRGGGSRGRQLAGDHGCWAKATGGHTRGRTWVWGAGCGAGVGVCVGCGVRVRGWGVGAWVGGRGKECACTRGAGVLEWGPQWCP